MYLKSLTMQGFKSFADKTKIEFDNEITGVVGPNGSGKSNISDAIMWVLGETSIKSLRGKKMEDVIFSGTNKRKPLGFAEVTILFNNIDRALNIDFDEVAVSRKMYRSLESEYRINGEKVRLKDVKELFMDTGIGKDGYSLIGQGRIDEVLSNSPDKRRAIFEEASGISKFKSKKQEALNKLNRTDQNITRISDIISEIATRVDELEEESKKAIKYLEYAGELKELDLTISKRDYSNIINYLKDRSTILKEKTSEFDKTNLNLEDFRNKEKIFKEDIEKLQIDLENLNLKNFENSNSLNEINSGINLLNQSIKNKREQIENANNSINDSIDKKEKTSLEFNQIQSEIDKLNEEKSNIDTLLYEKKKNLEDFILKNEENLLQRDILQKQHLEYLDKKSNLSSQIEVKTRLIEDRKNRKLELSKVVEKLESDIKDLEKSNSEINYKIGIQTREIDELKTDEAKSLKQLNKDREELSRINSEYALIDNKIINNATKIKSLESVIENFEGYSKSTKSFMSYAKNRNIFVGELIGPVGDNLKVRKEYETAINIALGSAVQNIIVKRQSAVYDMISVLKKNNYGRVTFIPIDTVLPGKLNFDLEPYKSKGILNYADSLIEVDAELKNIFSYLLGKIVIAKDYESALNFSNKTNNRFRVVTLDGESLNVGGTITGGSNKNFYSVLSRNVELDNLKKLTNDLHQDLSKIKEFIEKNTKQFDIKSNELKELNIKIVENNKKLALLNEQSVKIKLSLDNLNLTKDNYTKESQSLETGINSGLKDLEEFQDRFDKLNLDFNNLSVNKEENELKLKADSEKLNELKDKLYEVETKNKIIDEKLSSKSREKSLASIKMEEENKLLEENRLLLDRLNASIIEDESKISIYKSDLLNKQDLKTDISSNLEELKNTIFNKKQSYEKLLSDNENLRNDLFLLEKEIINLKNNIEFKNKEKSDLLTKVFEEYGVEDLDSINELENLSVTEARDRIKKLKDLISGLGTVNVASIEDYKNTKERLDFNLNQRTDLLNSKHELKKVIEKLDYSMKKNFKESIEKIGIYFNEIFKILFNGGQASIEIEGEEDYLNAGIEIKAQPPGKRFQSLSLLSGGEKAMTAVALLFALLKVRPAPFCILDEIDAALDDANITRYCDYLKTLEDIQFILITHRKLSMEIADVLYGVTMEELGVSKVISTLLKE